jgi:molybdopterin/thiamine biosynthesis adenylyltransferase
MSNLSRFNYTEAFSRNIGLVTEEEQLKLKEFTIAIPGMGGVGGAHLISLVRAGFEKFKIADGDIFELKNFNRQYGARNETLDRKKVEVMREEALKINPNCSIEIFDAQITSENIDAFLRGADLSLDALDAFEVDARRMLVNESLKRGIPVVGAGPIGFSTAFLVFLPGGPTFDEYFAVNETMEYKQKLISFFVGLVPSMLQRPYMKRTSLEERRGPSFIGAINLCAGVVSVYAIKILLRKGNIKAVPYYHQFDVMREKYVVKKLRFGNHSPIQRLKILIANKLLKD